MLQYVPTIPPKRLILHQNKGKIRRGARELPLQREIIENINLKIHLATALFFAQRE